MSFVSSSHDDDPPPVPPPPPRPPTPVVPPMPVCPPPPAAPPAVVWLVVAVVAPSPPLPDVPPRFAEHAHNAAVASDNENEAARTSQRSFVMTGLLRARSRRHAAGPTRGSQGITGGN